MYCNICGAKLGDKGVCYDYLNQMAQWDFEDFSGAGRLHLLTVTCYNLQHPAIYSVEGLEYAKATLKKILEQNDYSTQNVERAMSRELSSTSRKWKIMASLGDTAEYSHKVTWTMTSADVIAGGPNGYTDRIKEWAWSIFKDLESANLLN